jgi:ubiquinone/menaquinone biosynthesis C-methylase UbiE
MTNDRDHGIDVPAAFDRAAATYDTMVNLNPGYHRHLQSAADALVEKLRPGRGLTVIDLGCGSGASTDAIVNSMGHRGQAYTVIGVDGSPGMLAQARSKPWPTWVSFVQARAEQLSLLGSSLAASSGMGASVGTSGAAASGDDPVTGLRTGGAPGNGSHGGPPGVAGVLAAYLFRNVSDPDAVLAAVWDLLAPGGVLVAQDYSVAGSASARARWHAVSWSVVIPLSKVVNRDTGLYRYLWRSVLENDSVDAFAARMQRAGFVDVEHRTVGGWQHEILHIFRGRKPT